MADISPAAQAPAPVARRAIPWVAAGLAALRRRVAGDLDVHVRRFRESRSQRALRAMEAARHREEMRRRIDRMML